MLGPPFRPMLGVELGLQIGPASHWLLLISENLFRYAGLALLVYMPDHEVVVRHVDSGMATIVIERNVIAFLTDGLQIELFLIVDVLHRDHVDRADKPIPAVIGEKGPGWERLGLDVEHTDTWKEAREVHKRADLLVSRSLHDLAVVEGGLPLLRRRRS